MKLLFQPAKIALIIFICLFVFTIGRAASGDIDATFNASVSINPSSSNIINRTLRQPDGKIIVVGDYFEVAKGKFKKRIFRVNPDGTLDDTFNPPDINGNIKDAALQSNGKILVAGIFNLNSNIQTSVLIRLNSNGSLDPTFTFSAAGAVSGAIFDLFVLGDDRILVGGNFSYFAPNNSPRVNLTKLNPNGDTDLNFVPPTNLKTIVELAVQPNGMILGGSVDNGGGDSFLKRLNADGSVDNSFQALIRGFLYTVKIADDGKILIGGTFSNVNNTAKAALARLNSDGSLDDAFAGSPAVNSIVNDMEFTVDGRIVIGGSFTTVNGQNRPRLAKLDANGNLDPTFNFSNQLGFYTVTQIFDVNALPDGKIIIGGTAVRNGFSSGAAFNRINADGTNDTSFSVLIGTRGDVRRIAQAPNGQIYAIGTFAAANDTIRPSIVRFNADGTVDASFNAQVFGAGVDPIINGIAVQSDGKIVVGGQFLGMLRRLNTDGTVDNSFLPNLQPSGVIQDVAVQPDGKVIAAGSVDLGGSGNPPMIVRFNTNGTVDNSFSVPTPNNTVSRVILLPDGKLYIAGLFTSLGSTPRGRIARLNADGTVDTSFNPLGGANEPVWDVDVQADGKVLIAGGFAIVNGANQTGVARLNPNGTLDATFTGNTNNQVLAVKVQPNGKILIGGMMTAVNSVSRNRLARLNPDGTLDNSFNIGSGIDGLVRSINLQNDGKILVGGSFVSYNGVNKISIVRLLDNSAPLRTAFDFDGDSRADITVFRPSTFFWYQLLGINYQFSYTFFGASNDILTPADYDGDGKTDISIFRPSSGIWVYASSANGGAQFVINWGQNGDVPLPSDFNGDGKADFVVYRNGTWYRLPNVNNATWSVVSFGAPNDKPVIGDFDGDGKSDPAVFRPSTGEWFYASSAQGGTHLRAAQWGLATDNLVPADYDGDGKTDAAIYRNGLWAIYNSSNGSNTILTFGQAGDRAVAADYDGDGKADVAVYRPADGTWYMLRSTSGFQAVTFGNSTDLPAQNAFVR